MCESECVRVCDCVYTVIFILRFLLSDRKATNFPTTRSDKLPYLTRLTTLVALHYTVRITQSYSKTAKSVVECIETRKYQSW